MPDFSDDVSTRTSAGRLYHVLKKASALSHNGNVLSGWKQVLNIPSKTDHEGMVAIGQIVNLVDLVAIEITSLDIRTSRYLVGIPLIKNLLSPLMFGSNWNNSVYNKLNDGTVISSFAFCDERLIEHGCAKTT